MNTPLSEFILEPNDYGWAGRFPGGPYRLFGEEVSLEVHTRLDPDKHEVVPPISAAQAALVRTIHMSIQTVLARVESALTAYHAEFDPDFRAAIRHPHVWLDCERDDGVSWTFVVERNDNPDYGYHVEFEGAKFVELWAGD